MSKNVTQKLIESHLVAGAMRPDEEIGFKITYDNLYVRSLTTPSGQHQDFLQS